ncbi:Hypothetical predicted protein [Pelobates cultripes]|uniref:Uncharacterized protein n=1 Tax=Pelobates cultripes TaxID=61616 RepID=A0AAD1VNX8_PELCU|nr:Hypothetical predicted protein [Pelobates cultripes]
MQSQKDLGMASNDTTVGANRHQGEYAQKSCYIDEEASEIVQSDRERPFIDDVVATQQRADHRAKSHCRRLYARLLAVPCLAVTQLSSTRRFAVYLKSAFFQSHFCQ